MVAGTSSCKGRHSSKGVFFCLSARSKSPYENTVEIPQSRDVEAVPRQSSPPQTMLEEHQTSKLRSLMSLEQTPSTSKRRKETQTPKLSFRKHSPKKETSHDSPPGQPLRFLSKFFATFLKSSLNFLCASACSFIADPATGLRGRGPASPNASDPRGLAGKEGFLTADRKFTS
jgi:hypothetical protein